MDTVGSENLEKRDLLKDEYGTGKHSGYPGPRIIKHRAAPASQSLSKPDPVPVSRESLKEGIYLR